MQVSLLGSEEEVIQRQLKLKPTKKQERVLNEWLWHLTGVYNWAIRKIDLDARNGVFYSKMTFQGLLAGHAKKLGIPAHVIQGTLLQAYTAWQRCFRRISKRPKLKGNRNKLSSIQFPDPLRPPRKNRLTLIGIKSVKFHKQELPEGKIKCGRIIKRASGWYLCLVIDAQPNKIPIAGNGVVGIDPGFKHLLTLSTGEKVAHPRELEASLKRLGQAQRGGNKKLAARLQERIVNQRKDRNHKLSRRLIGENAEIYMSKDNLKGVAKKFGSSITSSGIGKLREMLSYKSSSCGRKYLEVPNRFSTVTCSTCGELTGPRGWVGLKVRFWDCSVCGTHHDRDVNAAMNTLRIGAGYALDGTVRCA